MNLETFRYSVKIGFLLSYSFCNEFRFFAQLLRKWWGQRKAAAGMGVCSENEVKPARILRFRAVEFLAGAAQVDAEGEGRRPG